MLPNLLFLTQRIPYPPIKGEKIRPLQILRHLAKTHRVHLGCLVDDPADMAHIPVIQEICADSYFAPLDRKRARITCLRGLLTGEPLSVTFFRDRGLAGWVRDVLARVRPKVIFVCSSNMASYVLGQDWHKAVSIVDLADVDSEKWRAYAETGTFPMRWVHNREWQKTAALEAEIAKRCDWSTFVTDAEAGLFKQLQPQASAHIRGIASGVDHVYFDPCRAYAPPYDTQRPNYLFTGTMDYKPNVDAVTWFAQDVLPLIRRSRPDAQFHIAGSNPAPSVQALAGDGIFVTGRIPDMRPHLAYATACVAPMLIARGIQNKVLEGMAMARPVVVTSGALEGIDAAPGSELLLADDTKTFAAHCLSVTGPDGAQHGIALGQAARNKVMSAYIWQERLRGFDALLQETAAAHEQETAGLEGQTP